MGRAYLLWHVSFGWTLKESDEYDAEISAYIILNADHVNIDTIAHEAHHAANATYKNFKHNAYGIKPATKEEITATYTGAITEGIVYALKPLIRGLS